MPVGANLANSGNMKILVADDDRVVSMLVCSLIRKKGWEAVPAFDANQAFMVAMQNPRPDAVVLDLGMPGGTGFEVLRRLKQSTKTSMIPVVVLSGTTNPDEPGKAITMGASAFLSKPPDPAALTAALSEALGLTTEEK